MDFRISGGFYRMSEPEGTVVSMPNGMESYIILRFYEPMVIAINGITTVTEADAWIILEPCISRQYGAVHGGFTNDYVSFIADESFVKRYDLPINKVFYVNNPRQLSSHIGFITWALTDVLFDHEKLIREQTEIILQYIRDNVISVSAKKKYLSHERYVAMRNEVQSEPSTWTVEKMAKKMHLSRSHFSVNYKNIFEVSPKDDLCAMIMNKAKRLLMETDENVSVIADKCGYTNTENFIRAFKRSMGITPLGYRKKQR